MESEVINTAEMRNSLQAAYRGYCVMDTLLIPLQSCQVFPKAVSSGLSLFLLFINDLLIAYQPGQSTVKLFAGHCILYRKVTSADDAECLQKD